MLQFVSGVAGGLVFQAVQASQQLARGVDVLPSWTTLRLASP
jgi:hypothetical protein